METSCPACGAAALAIDASCPACQEPLTPEEVRRRIGTTVLDNYEVTDVLGQGGMSVVYRARHRITGQEVALKILPPELAVHGQVKSRFLEEARALARLDHPNVVHLYNFGQDGASLVLAMQYVPGSTWERLILSQGRLDWLTSARIALDVLAALELAHGRDIIHRDMKPSNVLVRPDGSAMVMDFGIAKVTTSTRLTGTGQTMGTARYMSPEQIRGYEVDLRTDLYSLGVSLYESLCGETPFDGDSHFDIMTAHLTTPPPPLGERGAGVPPALERLVMTALGKDPEERPPSAAHMRGVLEELLAPHGPAPRRPSIELSTAPTATGTPVVRSRQRPILWLALATCALLAGAAAVVLIKANGASATRSRPESGSGSASDPGSASWPDPHLLAEHIFAVDQRFDPSRLRVLSLAPRDPDLVRASVEAARRDFSALLQTRGLTDVNSPTLNLVILPPARMCDRGLYETGAAPADCESRDYWYRPRERTLYLSDRPGLFEPSLAFAVAAGMCLHSQVSGCDAVAVQFGESAARAAGP